jgi:hypothetical protein
MKSVFSLAVPALLLMSASAFATDSTPSASPQAAAQQPSGGASDQKVSAGTGGLQGSQTGQAYMNGPAGNGSAGNGAGSSIAQNNGNNVNANEISDQTQTGAGMASNSGSGNTMNPSVSATSELSASADSSPTYQGGRRAYRGKSERSLNRSEAQETAQLNQEQSQFAPQ